MYAKFRDSSYNTSYSYLFILFIFYLFCFIFSPSTTLKQ